MERLDQGYLHPQLEIPETDTSRPGIEPEPPRLEASSVEKSLLNNVFNCYSEPLQ